MTKLIATMKTTEYTNKMRLKPVLFSNLVHMILSVYALNEDQFQTYLDGNGEDDASLSEKCAKIDSEDIKKSTVQMFPMMIRHDHGWDESPDIEISSRDRFLWWWVDYLCFSFEDETNHSHILAAITTCSMFKKKTLTTFKDIDQIFFPDTVKDDPGKGKDIIILDPLKCLSNDTNALFLSHIQMKDGIDSDSEGGQKTKNMGDSLEIDYEYQPLNVLLLCATHNLLNISKKDLSTKVAAGAPGAEPEPIIQQFLEIIKNYSVQVLPTNEGQETSDLTRRLRHLLKEQAKIPRMRAYKPKETRKSISEELKGLPVENKMQTKTMHDRRIRKIRQDNIGGNGDNDDEQNEGNESNSEDDVTSDKNEKEKKDGDETGSNRKRRSERTQKGHQNKKKRDA